MKYYDDEAEGPGECEFPYGAIQYPIIQISSLPGTSITVKIEDVYYFQ